MMMCPGGCFEIRDVYVGYHVQKGDTLWNLWKKTGMTRQEWIKVNEGRDPAALLYAGETIVIKDPIETCKQMDNYLLVQMSMMVGSDDVSVVCENRAFKPLQAFTKKLESNFEEVRKGNVVKK